MFANCPFEILIEDNLYLNTLFMVKKEKILAIYQQQFLEFASKQDYISKNFYLTGGTALAAFYLHHRMSEDLDFFVKEAKRLEKEIFRP